MALLNDGRTYGALTKLFHWLIVALFAFQYVAAAIMLNSSPRGRRPWASQHPTISTGISRSG